MWFKPACSPSFDGVTYYRRLFTGFDLCFHLFRGWHDIMQSLWTRFIFRFSEQVLIRIGNMKRQIHPLVLSSSSHHLTWAPVNIRVSMWLLQAPVCLFYVTVNIHNVWHHSVLECPWITQSVNTTVERQISDDHLHRHCNRCWRLPRFVGREDGDISYRCDGWGAITPSLTARCKPGSSLCKFPQ